MKKIILSATLFTLLFVSCEKEANRKMLGAYFRYEVNGNKINITNDNTIYGTNIFNCVLRGDSALSIAAAQSFDGAGFNIKANNLHDGTYTLDSTNKAYYTNPKDFKRYSTSSLNKGTLTIAKKTFQAKTLLNTLEGTFSFTGVDPMTQKTFTITNGAFLMELKRE